MVRWGWKRRVVTPLSIGIAGVATLGLTGKSGPAPVVFHPTVSDYAQVSTSTTPPTQAQCFSVNRRCFSPQAIQSAYNLSPLYQNNEKGQGETIAIVDSYGSDTIAHDLHV
ncbi:MAG: hypothetical protein ABR498_09735, partial [Candidatus Dormibacteria bacterium]